MLDTWFSSWLWPMSTMGWPEATEDLAAFYPTDTLVTDSGITVSSVTATGAGAITLTSTTGTLTVAGPIATHIRYRIDR